MNTLVDTSTLARILGLTERRAYQLARAGFLPRAAPGRYDLLVAIPSYLNALRRRAGGLDEAEDENLSLRDRLSKLKGDLLEVELQKIRGEVVDVEVVAKVVGEQLAACRARLLAIPTSTATLVVAAQGAAEAQKILEAAVREALAELSDADILERATEWAPGEGGDRHGDVPEAGEEG